MIFFLTAEKNGYLVNTSADTPYLVSNGAFSAGLVDLSNSGANVWIKQIIHNNMVDSTGALGIFTEEWATVNRKQ